MISIFIILLVLVAILLMGVILIQSSKGGGLAGTFGGGGAGGGAGVPGVLERPNLAVVLARYQETCRYASPTWHSASRGETRHRGCPRL